jgi:phosphoglycolate phosphatase
VLTNKPLAPTEKVLAGLGMRDLFDDVIGSDGPYPRKPDPAGLRALMERAGATPERTLMVGDSRIDYETATRATTRCCLVAYGFSTHTLDGVPTGDAWVAADASTLANIIARFVATV